LTICKRLARENTNDYGDPLNPATASILILEFKKYLFLCALRLIYDRNHVFEKGAAPDGKIVYMAPFPAPPFIMKAWDEIILYSDAYKELCEQIFHGYLDKPKYANKNEEFDAYDYMYRLLVRKRRILHPFWNFWPKYAKKEYYFEDK
jgi:hypothetical protein